jgi:DNA repair and recombination protein RAD52
MTPFNSTELKIISTQLDQDHSTDGVELCNFIFGFNNWSSEIRELRLYYTIEDVDDKKILYSSGASAICRILLRDGSYRDATGSGECAIADTKMKSIEVAQQAAIEDGMQKCLAQFRAGKFHADHPMLRSVSGPINMTSCGKHSRSDARPTAQQSLPLVATSNSMHSSPSAPYISTSYESQINVTNICGQKRESLPQQDYESRKNRAVVVPPTAFSSPLPTSNASHKNPGTHSISHTSESHSTVAAVSAADATYSTGHSSVAGSSASSLHSPTVEDIDSLMQQYDQRHATDGRVYEKSSTSTASTSYVPYCDSSGRPAQTPVSTTISTKSTYGGVNANPPCHASLKGQKYPPKPNLHNPFDK